MSQGNGHKQTTLNYYPPDSEDIKAIVFLPGSEGQFRVRFVYRIPSSQDLERGVPFMEGEAMVTVQGLGTKKFSTVETEIVKAVAEQEPTFLQEAPDG
jgi:hypothetical protein